MLEIDARDSVCGSSSDACLGPGVGFGGSDDANDHTDILRYRPGPATDYPWLR